MNFCLRGKESDEDQLFCEDLAKAADVPSFVVRVSDKEHGNYLISGGVQEWARERRYAELRKLAAQGWLIAIAHTEDDVAENVLLRISRGTSVGRAAGMKRFSPPFWRPFLAIPKSALESYLKEIGASYRTDSSNNTLDYSRNTVRHKVLSELDKLYPGAARRIAQFGVDAQEMAAFCEEALARYAQSKEGYAEIHADTVRNLAPSLAYGVLGQAIKEVSAVGVAPGSRVPQLSREFLKAAIDQLLMPVSADQPRWSRDIPGGGRVNVLNGRLWVESENQKLGKQVHDPTKPKKQEDN